MEDILGTANEITAEEKSRTAVSKMGAVGEESINKLNNHVPAMVTIRMRAQWNPNAVPLKISRL